jgi:hypothetical protein
MIAAAPEDPPDAAPWVTALKHGPFDTLDLPARLDALTWLCGVVGGGLGVRNLLDAREKEAATLKKQLLEDARLRHSALVVQYTTCQEQLALVLLHTSCATTTTTTTLRMSVCVQWCTLLHTCCWELQSLHFIKCVFERWTVDTILHCLCMHMAPKPCMAPAVHGCITLTTQTSAAAAAAAAAAPG